MPRAARLLLSCLLAGVLAGCGSESGSGGADADPATLVPASAALYVEAVVRPEGEQREGAMAAMGKVLRTADPERRLRELIEKEAREEGSDFDYDRDVKPWLGKRAGVTVSDLQADEPSVLIAAAATDTGKAIEAIEKERKRSKEKSREGSYEGIDYRVDGDGMAVGAIEDFLVVGHERLFSRPSTPPRASARSPRRPSTRMRSPRSRNSGSARCTWTSSRCSTPR
jgi:hypothetical protein